MSRYFYNEVQNLLLNQAAILNTAIPCPRGNVIHEDGSGIIVLRGAVNNPTACFARYKVTANANIAIPEGGTAGPIAIALTVNGEPRLTSRAIVTPTAVDAYNNVTSTSIIDVPRGCCFTVSVRSVAGTDDPTATPAPVIEIQNLGVDIDRVA